jgi:hypothetical protein
MDHQGPTRQLLHPIGRWITATFDRQRVILFIDLAVIVNGAHMNRRAFLENGPFHETPERYVWALACALRCAWGSVKNVAARP